MKKISEEEFELEFEEIKNSDFELIPKHNKTQKGENMKNNKRIIETIKTIAIAVLLALPVGIYIGIEYQKQENAKIIEQVRNLSQK